jgi:sulfur carrier protein
MQIKVNDKTRETENGISLLSFLENAKITASKTVVTLNGATLDLDQFETTVLKENDKLELFSFVGGG